MPYILALIVSFVPLIVQKVLALLGIGLVTYVGSDFLLTKISDLIYSQLNGLSSDAVALLNLGGFDTALQILLASYSITLTINKLKAGSSIIFGAK